MNVKFYLSDTYVCGHIRGELPARELNAHWNNVRVDCKTDVLCSDFYGTDLMVFQRLYTPVMLEKMRIAKSLGIKTVYELDDNVFDIPPSFKEPFDFFSKPEVQETIQCFVQEVDALTVSTLPLGQITRTMTKKPTFVVENAIDLDRWRDAQIQRDLDQLEKRDKIVIGWVASESHFIDIPAVAESLLKLFEKHPNVELHVIGSLGPHHFKEHGITDRVKYFPWGEINALPFQMRHFDIAIAPLMRNKFNDCKSGIKWMQYAALGIPCICSRCPSYTDFEGPSLLVEDGEPWFKALDELVSDKDYRYKIGRKDLHRVQAYDMNKKAGDWFSAWHKILKLEV